MLFDASVLHRCFSLYSSIAPTSAGRLVFKRWFKTSRHALSQAETACLLQAVLTDVEWGSQQGMVRVYEWGEGPVALLVHGWNGRASQFYRVADLLRTRGYKVVAFDLPGHAQSAGDYSDLPSMTQAIEAVCKRYGSVALMIAHSLGSLAAARASASGCAPQQLILVAPPASIRTVVDRMLQQMSLSRSARTTFETLFEGKFGPRVWQDFSFEGIGPLLATATDTVIIHDRKDREIPWSEGEQVSMTISNARLCSTDRLGHYRILRANAFLELLDQCLAPS